MRQQPVNIIGGAYTDDALPWSCQDTVNLLPVAAEAAGTRTPTKFSTAPGLRPWVKIGDGADYAIRGMRDVEGKLFAVSGSMLYQIGNTGIAIPRGVIPGVGRVSMAHNQITGGNELLVVNGDSGFVWNTVDETFTKITDEGYPGAFVADFIDGYLAQVEPFGRFWFHSDLASALEYSTIDRYEAESSPDRIVALLSDHLEVWVFGERTAEIFANTGAGTGTFQSKRISIEKGCAGQYTPAKLDNGVAWLGSDGVVYQAQGYNPVRISTRAIESAIAGLDWSKAFAFTWADRGHEVYYLTFPSGQTFGYDASQRQWHRRASWHPVYDIARRWRVNDIARHNGQWIAGDYRSGELYVLDWDYPREGDTDPLVRERVGGVMHSHQNRVSIPFAEVIVEAGGEPVAAVEFPAQPEGPSISGEAPDGALGTEYAGFTYTTTEGDAPIGSVTLVSGSLPPGLSFDDGTIDDGIPTALNSYTFTIRVTDTNGLWSELTDTIYIVGVSFATINGSPGHLMVSATGESWGGDLDTGLGADIRLLKALGGRVFAFAADGSGRVSSDYGQTWEDTSGVVPEEEVYFPITMAYSDGVWIVAMSAGQMFARSTDGVNFTMIDHGTARSWYCSAAIGDTFIVGGNNGRGHISTDKGLTWAETVIAAGDIQCLTAYRDDAYVAFASGSLHVSADGTTGSWIVKSFPGTSFLAHYLLPLDTRIVLTAGDDTYYSDDIGDSWEVGGGFSSGVSGAAPENNITHNGVRFIVGLDDSIDISDDGDTWAVAFNNPLSGTPIVTSLGEVPE